MSKAKSLTRLCPDNEWPIVKEGVCPWCLELERAPVEAEMIMSESYIAQKECGCLVMAVVNNPDHRREVAREVSRAIREGLQVSIVPSEQVRTMAWECETHKKGAKRPHFTGL